MEKFLIVSENSSDHWPFFDIENKNVLDIGCGIWYTEDMEETSPIWFANRANMVVGIDGNGGDIQRYQDYVGDNPKYVFREMRITDAEQVRELINEYSITALKCDIEGGEIALLDLTAEDLVNVSSIAIEFHNDELKEGFLQKIPEWGFNIEVYANFAATPLYMGVIYGTK